MWPGSGAVTVVLLGEEDPMTTAEPSPPPPPPVSGTPIPGALALFPAGLGVIAYLSRRRKRQDA